MAPRTNKQLTDNYPTALASNGAMQSNIGVDWLYFPWEAATVVAQVMHDNSEAGRPNGYPLENWRGIPSEDHANHIAQHLQKLYRLLVKAKLEDGLYDEDVDLIKEHAAHIGCRALMLIQKLDDEMPDEE